MSRAKKANFSVDSSDRLVDVIQGVFIDASDREVDHLGKLQFAVRIDDEDYDGAYQSGTIVFNLLNGSVKAVSGRKTLKKGTHRLMDMSISKLKTLIDEYARAIPFSGGEAPYDTPSIQDRYPDYDAYMSGRYASKKTAARFNLGQVVQTRGVAHAMRRDPEFAGEIMDAFNKYRRGDWGDTQSDSKRRNNAVLRGEEDQVFAVYNTSQGTVYIITEWDGSVTTILFANEY